MTIRNGLNELIAAGVWMIVTSVVLGQDAIAQARSSPSRSSVYALNGVVCTNHPLASQVGLRVLEAGGNAFDAAVAAAAVMNVTEPMMTGIGGDMFALCWVAKERRLVGLNGSGRSGSGFSIPAFQARGLGEIPETGALSVTVPGAVAGWSDLLERYGTWRLAQALEPAAQIAEHGFLVTENVAYFWDYMAADLKSEAARRTFLTSAGRAPKQGDLHRNPDLAKTFRELGEHGKSWLYGGDLGKRLVAYLEKEGGLVTLEDLAQHSSSWVEPISASYGEFSLWELPPNGQGIAALEMLRIVDTPAFRELAHNSPDYVHQLIEAKKLAYADLEVSVGDPSQMGIRPTELLDGSFVERRRHKIDFHRAATNVEPDERLLATDTTYLAVADREGNMVSFINSLCGGFGSCLVVPGTGFALQNRGVGFTLREGRANTAAPRRLPFHTIIPAFITRTDSEGKIQPWGALGVMGGDNQPQAHVQVFLNLVQYRMGAQTAIDAPRFRHTRGATVAFENRLPPAVVAELTRRGHEAFEKPYSAAELYGTGHVILRLEHGYEAGSDTRGDGLPAGY